MTIAAADQGTGATIAFTTSSFAANITKIGGFDITRGSIETTHLGTTVSRTFQPEDLIDNGEVEIEGYYDPDTQPPITGPAETITITMPKPAAYSTAATAAGSGFCTSFAHPALEANKVMMFKAKFKWAGTVTFTDHT